jgi:hypothetical protein
MTPAMRLSIREDGDLILLAADPLRVFAVTRQGHSVCRSASAGGAAPACQA